jgi:acetolactate synthase-1/3 small subunit
MVSEIIQISDDNRYVLSVLVFNHSGALSRISGLFSRRGYNISSLSVGETEDKDVSRMTIEFYGDEHTAEQLKKQLNKLEDVIKLTELQHSKGVFRELLLLKVAANDETRPAIMEIANIFRAKVDDISKECLTMELTGGRSKTAAFLEMMNGYGIKEIARTGLTALERGNSELKAHDKLDTGNGTVYE